MKILDDLPLSAYVYKLNKQNGHYFNQKALSELGIDSEVLKDYPERLLEILAHPEDVIFLKQCINELINNPDKPFISTRRMMINGKPTWYVGISKILDLGTENISVLGMAEALSEPTEEVETLYKKLRLPIDEQGVFDDIVLQSVVGNDHLVEVASTLGTKIRNIQTVFYKNVHSSLS
jgi:hypothetical protein